MPLRVSCYEEEHDRIERQNKSKEIMHACPLLYYYYRCSFYTVAEFVETRQTVATARPTRSRRPDPAAHPAHCCSSPCALSLSRRCSSPRALSPSRSRSAPHRSAAAARSRCPAATLHARRWPQETDEEHRSRTGQSRQDRRQTKGSKAANSRTSTAPAMADETEQSERGSRLAETGRGEAARSPVEPLRRRDNRRSPGRTPFPLSPARWGNETARARLPISSSNAQIGPDESTSQGKWTQPVVDSSSSGQKIHVPTNQETHMCCTPSVPK